MNTTYNNYPPDTAYGSRSGFPAPTGYKPANSNNKTIIGVVAALLVVALVVIVILLIVNSNSSTNNNNNNSAVTGNPCVPNPCNHGACSDNGDKTFTCDCNEGYTGSTCDTEAEQPQGACATSPCKNKGTCTETATGFSCACATGYSGTTCTTVAGGACASKPCKNSGTCRTTTTGYACTCATGWSGSTCGTPAATKCSADTCQNDGTCNEADGSCECPEGYSGDQCETEEGTATPCSPNPCKNSGVCSAATGTAVCKCATGWTGTTCTVAAATCNPTCANGGTCKDGSCVCATGFSGASCSECTLSCKNGGSCQVSGGKPACKCATGFSGDSCETQACTKVCANGGTCSISAGTQSCKCASGYSGDTCETKTTPAGTACTFSPITIASKSQRGDVPNSSSGPCKNYKYELWVADSMSNSRATMTVSGKAAAFKVDWQINGGQSDFVARVGLGYDSTKTAAQLAPIQANFTYTITGTGQAWVGLYGWTYSPLMEYYVVEAWNEWRPTYQGKGSITVDGQTYDVYTNTQQNQPSINGTQTFPQIYSVATTSSKKRTTGTITVSDHFAKWNGLGLQAGGKLYEAMLVVEGMKASGAIEFTQGTVTDGTMT